MQNLELDIQPGGTADVLGNYVAGKIQQGDSMASGMANQMTGAAEQFAAGTTDMAFEMMDTLMQDVVTKGVDAIYEALGLNAQTLQLASTLVQSAKNAATIGKDVAQFIPMSKDCFPMAKNVLTELILQYIQVVMQPLIQQVVYTYYELKNAVLLLDRDSVTELALAVGFEVLDTITQMVDEQVFKYTGYTIMEIYYKCAKGFQQMAAYKRAKRIQRQQNSDNQGQNGGDGDPSGGDSPETDVRDNVTQIDEHNADPKLNVTVDSEQIKKDLIDWAMKQSDMLYNAFLLINLRDMCLSIKDTFKNISCEGFENIADSVNSLDDFMNLLEELGIGEAPVISLDDIVNQGLSVVNSAVGTAQKLASPDTVTSFVCAAGGSLASNTNASVSTKPSFDIKTELNDNKGIDMNIVLHMDPNKKSVYRDMQESLKNIKYEKKSIFDNAKIKLIINKCISCWTDGSIDNFDVIGVTSDKNITYTVSVKKDEYKEETPEPQPEPEQYVPAEWKAIEEAWADDPNKLKSDKKPIVELINIIVQLLMPLSKLLQIIAHLIQNYRINKAFAKSQANVTLAEAVKGAMAAAGFIQDVIAKLINKKLADGANFYCIRTKLTYDWLIKKFGIHPDDHQTCIIESHQTKIFCAYAKEQNLLLWEQLNVNKPTILFIDFEGMRRDKYKDGTMGGIDNMMYLEDIHEVMFTNGMRNQMSSQILNCMRYDDKPNDITR